MEAIRSKENATSMQDFEEAMHWNWELYDEEEEEESDESWEFDSDDESDSETSGSSEEEPKREVEMWQCRGCEKVMQLKSKPKHRGCCSSYVGSSDLILEHSSTSCHCCVLHRFYNTYPKIHWKEIRKQMLAEKKRKASSKRSKKKRKK